jgi:DNA-binding PadR family transcriptional regulator
VKILKKRKNMQRSDITRFIEETIKRFRPTFEQITKAFEKLQNSNYIEINREKGIISYLE